MRVRISSRALTDHFEAGLSQDECVRTVWRIKSVVGIEEFKSPILTMAMRVYSVGLREAG